MWRGFKEEEYNDVGESKREPPLMVSDARDPSQVLVWLEASDS